MNCTEFENKLDAYVDGELNEKIIEFEEHRHTCQSCQQLYDETIEIKNMLNQLEPLELPEDFESELHEKLIVASREMKVIPLHKRFQGMKVLASVAALLLVSIMAYKAVPFGNNSEANYSSNMDFNETASENMMAMESFDADDALGNMVADEALPTVAFSSEAPLSKSARVVLDNEVYADEAINYWIEIPTQITSVDEFLNRYKLLEFEVTDGQYTFYINNADFEVFSDNLKDLYGVNNEVIIDLSMNNEEKYGAYLDQEAFVKALEADETSDDPEVIEYEKKVLDELSKEAELIKQYTGYKRVTIIIDKE